MLAVVTTLGYEYQKLKIPVWKIQGVELPVVQDWCLHIANTDKNVNGIQLNELALISVGYSVPTISNRDFSKLQQRLLPHANYIYHLDWSDDTIELLGVFHCLGNLYSNQGKLKEAKEMYQRALIGKEKALGPNHTSTLDTGKLKEAEEMYQRALAGYEKALGPDNTPTLNTVDSLGVLYKAQDKLKKAEDMYQRGGHGSRSR
ncbi:hypothetical protein N7463_009329 [Penicillium fimorum]|uniref:Kinesin light chain n=1 Tax=Penicillium fimorum TaxID=1882269 RepID=A0A9W9XQJ9_9EURO|nr:hypothetical protein N7463_009329 [Penicillium fimorum]